MLIQYRSQPVIAWDCPAPADFSCEPLWDKDNRACINCHISSITLTEHCRLSVFRNKKSDFLFQISLLQEVSFDNNYREDDELIKEEAVKYLRETLVSAEKSFSFVYLGDVDGTGHSDGWCSAGYLLSVDRADIRVS